MSNCSLSTTSEVAHTSNRLVFVGDMWSDTPPDSLIPGRLPVVCLSASTLHQFWFLLFLTLTPAGGSSSWPPEGPLQLSSFSPSSHLSHFSWSSGGLLLCYPTTIIDFWDYPKTCALSLPAHRRGTPSLPAHRRGAHSRLPAHRRGAHSRLPTHRRGAHSRLPTHRRGAPSRLPTHRRGASSRLPTHRRGAPSRLPTHRRGAPSRLPAHRRGAHSLPATSLFILYSVKTLFLPIQKL